MLLFLLYVNRRFVALCLRPMKLLCDALPVIVQFAGLIDGSDYGLPDVTWFPCTEPWCSHRPFTLSECPHTAEDVTSDSPEHACLGSANCTVLLGPGVPETGLRRRRFLFSLPNHLHLISVAGDIKCVCSCSAPRAGILGAWSCVLFWQAHISLSMQTPAPSVSSIHY